MLAICYRYDGYSKVFLTRRKELSHKFNVGEEPNRQKESSLDDFIANATRSVFTESLKSEDCVMQKVFSMRKRTSVSQIKGKNKLKKVIESRDFISTKFHRYEREG